MLSAAVVIGALRVQLVQLSAMALFQFAVRIRQTNQNMDKSKIRFFFYFQ